MSKTFLLDLFERAGKTALQAFLAAVIPSLTVSSFSDLSGLQALALSGLVAAIGAALSVITSALSAPVGTPGTASLVRLTRRPRSGHTVYKRRIPERVVPGKPLGRHVNHDSRSLNYLVPEIPKKAVATALWERRTPILDQGNLGSCTGNAACGSLGTDPFFGSLTGKIAAGLKLDENEAVALYSAATKLDSAPGSYPPDDTGSDGLSVAKAAKNAGLISAYLHITSVAAAQNAIQTGPFIVGTNWYEGMDNPDSTGLVKPTGAVRGGHEYLCVGYDADKDLWHFDNSWGTSYGVDGTFCYSSATFKKLLAEQGDATVFVPLAAAPFPPNPTPTPVPPAGASVVVDDPALVTKIESLAAHNGTSAHDYLANRLRHLWHIKASVKRGKR